MIQVMKMSGKYYAVDVDRLDNDEKMERIEQFTNQGTPVLTLNSVDDLWEFDIDIDDVQMVELD